MEMMFQRTGTLGGSSSNETKPVQQNIIQSDNENSPDLMFVVDSLLVPSIDLAVGKPLPLTGQVNTGGELTPALLETEGVTTQLPSPLLPDAALLKGESTDKLIVDGILAQSNAHHLATKPTTTDMFTPPHMMNSAGINLVSVTKSSSLATTATLSNMSSSMMPMTTHNLSNVEAIRVQALGPSLVSQTTTESSYTLNTSKAIEQLLLSHNLTLKNTPAQTLVSTTSDIAFLAPSTESKSTHRVALGSVEQGQKVEAQLSKLNASLLEKVTHQVANNIKEIRVRLDPPELGSIRLAVNLDADSKLQIQMQANTAHTREMLNAVSERLKTDLIHNNQFIDVSVDIGSSDQPQQQQADTDSVASLIEDNQFIETEVETTDVSYITKI